VGASERIMDRGTRRGERSLKSLADDYRTARLMLGLSQREVSEAAHVSRSAYGRVEGGSDRHLTVLAAARIAAVLGLDFSARAYPGDAPIRDVAHAKRLTTLLVGVAPPLHYRADVPLPRTTDHPERRAWDAVVWGHGQRTVIELETRIYDVQGQLRKIHLKTRDDPADHTLLVVADTRANRRAVHDFADLFPDYPRQRTAVVLKSLRAGKHPPTGLIFL
jgi:transcriptional regulator with XRE-family HTH domain